MSAITLWVKHRPIAHRSASQYRIPGLDTRARRKLRAPVPSPTSGDM